MPELPEVETVRRTLKNFVLNKRIISIDIMYPKIIEDNIEEFKNKVCNQVINDIDRIGKFLIFKLRENTYNRYNKQKSEIIFYKNKKILDNFHTL